MVGMDLSLIHSRLSIFIRLLLIIKYVSADLIRLKGGYEFGRAIVVGMEMALIRSWLSIAIRLLLIIKYVSAALVR